MRRTAAEAALSRVQTQKKDDTQFNTSLAAIRAQVQRELEAERKAKAELEKDQVASHEVQPKILDDQCNRNLAAQGVYFRWVFVALAAFLFKLNAISSTECDLDCKCTDAKSVRNHRIQLFSPNYLNRRLFTPDVHAISKEKKKRQTLSLELTISGCLVLLFLFSSTSISQFSLV